MYDPPGGRDREGRVDSGGKGYGKEGDGKGKEWRKGG